MRRIILDSILDATDLEGRVHSETNAGVTMLCSHTVATPGREGSLWESRGVNSVYSAPELQSAGVTA